MDNDSQRADDIRRQMHAFRSRLQGDVHGVVENAKQLVDWRYYYRHFPWGTLSLAAGLGYLIVPRRPRTVPANAATLQELAEDKRLVVKPRSGGWMASMASSIAPIVLKAGIDRIGKQMATGARDKTEEQRLVKRSPP